MYRLSLYVTVVTAALALGVSNVSSLAGQTLLQQANAKSLIVVGDFTEGTQNQEEDSDNRSHNVGWPSGFTLGLSVAAYRLDSNVRVVNGFKVRPSINIGYLTSSGRGFDLSASIIRQGGEHYERFDGMIASIGMIYRFRNSGMLLKGGISAFGGGYGESSQELQWGPSIGLGVIFAKGNHIGMGMDVMVLLAYAVSLRVGFALFSRSGS